MAKYHFPRITTGVDRQRTETIFETFGGLSHVQKPSISGKEYSENNIDEKLAEYMYFVPLVEISWSSRLVENWFHLCFGVLVSQMIEPDIVNIMSKTQLLLFNHDFNSTQSILA